MSAETKSGERPADLIPYEDLYSTLQTICRTLEREKISYFLSGGTMLGAVREKNIIAHDYDFDLDCLSDDYDRVMSLSGVLSETGIELRPKRVTVEDCVLTPEGVSPDRTVGGSSIWIYKNGRHYGDIGVFTIFSDGIARRVDLIDRIYFNSKMSAPAWFYENYSEVELGGETFRTYPAPDLMCEKVYGPNWRDKYMPGDALPGYGKNSGSFNDSDIEKLWAYALSKGWDSDYSDRPEWPTQIDFVKTNRDLRWIHSHEAHLRNDLPAVLHMDSIEQASHETSQRRVSLYMRLFIAETLHYCTLKGLAAEAQKKALQKQMDGLNKNITELKRESAQLACDNEATKKKLSRERKLLKKRRLAAADKKRKSSAIIFELRKRLKEIRINTPR